MGWEVSDNRKFQQWFFKLGGAERAAILGDCTFYAPRGVGNNGGFAKHYGLSCVESFDVYGEPTHTIDLNQEIPEDYYNRYDWVIDAGTAFCCFNPAQVLFNIHNMLKPEGIVFQFASLFGYLNRGYYSFHPILLQEFYEQNGYTILELCWRKKGNQWETMEDINMFQKESMVNNDSAVLIIAKKLINKLPVAPKPNLYS